MGTYQDNMADEKKPASLLPEGLRLVRVTEMIEEVSKKGNKMFVATLEDVKTRKTMPVWLIAEPKKRWMLKNLLACCEVGASADGVYDWSTTDVIGKTVVANVEHYQEPWINRDGVEVMTNKAKVTEFLTPEKDAASESVAWKE